MHAFRVAHTSSSRAYIRDSLADKALPIARSNHRCEWLVVALIALEWAASALDSETLGEGISQWGLY